MNLTHAIERCLGGDKAAYEEVVASHSDKLVLTLCKLLGNIEDARDVAQDTFVKAYMNLHRFDTRRPFEPWLYRIARNQAYNLLKAKGRRPYGALDGSSEEWIIKLKSETKSPLAGVLESETQKEIEKVLSGMRPEFREILALRYMERLDYEEISKKMRIPVGTVKTWLNRAKTQFRKNAEGRDLLYAM